jgi:hypothetical protein
MYFDRDHKSRFYSYSFQLLDDRMRRRREDLWRRYRSIYLFALFLVFGFTFGWEASQSLISFVRYKAPFLVQGCFCNDDNVSLVFKSNSFDFSSALLVLTRVDIRNMASHLTVLYMEV